MSGVFKSDGTSSTMLKVVTDTFDKNTYNKGKLI